MPPRASWAPTSVVRSLLKPMITKPTRATSTAITMIAMSIAELPFSRVWPETYCVVGAGQRRSPGTAAAASAAAAAGEPATAAALDDEDCVAL